MYAYFFPVETALEKVNNNLGENSLIEIFILHLIFNGNIKEKYKIHRKGN